MPVSKEEYVSNIWKEGSFDGKVVFCTGGSGSICSAQVRALVYLGANACIVGRNVEKTQRVARDIASARTGARVLGLGAVDVRKIDALEAAAKQCVEELGAIDFVIAGAAGNFLAPIRSLSANAFKTVIDIDLLGSYNAVKATYPYLVESAAKYKVDSMGKVSPGGTGGRIVFVSATTTTGLPLQTHMMAAKSGVDAISHNVGIELGPLGVTSNVIAPGPIRDTAGVDRLTPSADVGLKSASKIPLGRWGTVRDIADATVYLFSEAGSLVNAATLVVDGGAWRTFGGQQGHTVPYPDFILSDKEITAKVGNKRSKI